MPAVDHIVGFDGLGALGANIHDDGLSIRSPAEVTAAVATLRRFAAAGYDLFPLKVLGKAPRDHGWQGRDYSGFEFRRWLKVGGNVGIRLGATDLVIDCDPRNYVDDDDPLDRLSADVGVDLAAAPTTITGSGGRHLFYRKPAEVRVVGRLAAYEGIDFKQIGGLVVCAGSIHPDTGEVYRVDPSRQPIAMVGAAPESLVDMIRRPERKRRDGGGGEITPEQLAVLLAALDPRDYGRGKYDIWIRLCAACHDATNGDGLEEWLAWCARDPDYDHPDDLEAVVRHWESFTAGQPQGVTYRTLLAAVSAAGRGDLVARLGAEDDIVDDESILYELAEEEGPIVYELDEDDLRRQEDTD